MIEEEYYLNPVLNLTFSVNDAGIYTYYLTTSVPNLFIGERPKEVISEPSVVEKIALETGNVIDLNEVNIAVEYAATLSGVQKSTINITDNPKGEKGLIIVLVAPVNSSNGDPGILNAGPEASGRTIIRFEKAKPN